MRKLVYWLSRILPIPLHALALLAPFAAHYSIALSELSYGPVVTVIAIGVAAGALLILAESIPSAMTSWLLELRTRDYRKMHARLRATMSLRGFGKYAPEERDGYELSQEVTDGLRKLHIQYWKNRMIFGQVLSLVAFGAVSLMV